MSGPLGGRVGGENAGQHHAAQDEARLDLHQDLQAADVARGGIGRKSARLPGQRRADDQKVHGGDAQRQHEGDQLAQQGASVGGDGERFGSVDVQVRGDGAGGGHGQRGAERQCRKAPYEPADEARVMGDVAAQQAPGQGGETQQAAAPDDGCQDVHDIAEEGDGVGARRCVAGEADRAHERQPGNACARRPGSGGLMLRQREQGGEGRRQDRLEQRHLPVARRGQEQPHLRRHGYIDHFARGANSLRQPGQREQDGAAGDAEPDALRRSYGGGIGGTAVYRPPHRQPEHRAAAQGHERGKMNGFQYGIHVRSIIEVSCPHRIAGADFTERETDRGKKRNRRCRQPRTCMKV